MSTRKSASVSKLRPPSMVGIRIRMDRDFDRFEDRERNEFTLALQELLGLGDDDIQEISFRKGCVIFDANVPLPVFRKLCAMYDSLKEDPENDELEALRELIEKFSVVDISDLTPYAVHVRVTDKTEPDERDHVIFIHGWSGSAKSFGEFPNFIEQELHCRSIVYEYPTRRLRKSPAITYLACHFDNWVRNNAAAARKLALVAHSMGGLVVRKFIADQCRKWKDDPLDQMVRQITLMASPYDGTTLAKLASVFSWNVQLHDLSPDSTMLFDTNRDWEQWVEKNVPNNCRVRCIVSAEDKIVSVNNARGFDQNPVVLLDKGHKDIVTPKSRNDEVVKTLTRLLIEAGIGSQTEDAEKTKKAG